MNILGWDFSEKFKKYISQLKYVDFGSLKFEEMERESNEFNHGRLGYSYTSSDNIHHIGIRPLISNQLAEVIACHEIEHVELRYSGFNIEIKPAVGFENQEYWVEFCTSLQSTFSDIIINSKLKKMGYSFKEYFDGVFNSLSKVKFKNKDPKPVQLINCLRACKCRFDFNGERWNECQKTYLKKATPIFLKGMEIYKIAKETGFETPSQYIDLMRKLIEYLNVKNEVIICE